MLVKYDGEIGIQLLANAMDWLSKERRPDVDSHQPRKRDSDALVTFNRAWNEWRCEQVTEVVRMVRRTMKRQRPSLVLGAAVTPRGYHIDSVFQDWKRWVREGYIDYAYPMDYFASNRELKNALEWQGEGVPKSSIVPLLGLYERQGAETVPVSAARLTSQMKIVEGSGFSGVGLFSDMRLSAEIEEALRVFGELR